VILKKNISILKVYVEIVKKEVIKNCDSFENRKPFKDVLKSVKISRYKGELK